MTYDEDHVTSPLCELALGTIVEAQEGSNGSCSGDSETLSCSSEPPEPPPTTPFKKDIKLIVPECQKESIPTKNPNIDGGWAYVVFVCMFLIFTITSGLLYTTGLYYVQMLQVYEHSRSYTAWVGSLVNAFFMLGGPVSSAFIQRFGCRSSIMFGSLMMTIGYIASAFSQSLEMLFFTYGGVVALGMNFCYSGQIITLAQYFDKKHSIATSASMSGIGVGTFFMSSLTEKALDEYGWRGSFLLSAGLSLQIAVLGALIFPLKNEVTEPVKSISVQQENYQHETVHKRLPKSTSRGHFEKTANDKSFSSLQMSMGASYLSHSLLSLSDPKMINRGNNEYDFTSNQHSFCSRGSNFGVRSNAYSFSHRESHNGLSQYDLRSNQYSFHQRDSYQSETGIKSNNQSFCSRKGSQAGMSGIISKPASFYRKTSQVELSPPQPHDTEMEKLFVSEYVIPVVPKANFLIHEGDCDLSCCAEELEEPGTSTAPQEWSNYQQNASRCSRLYKKLILRTQTMICSLNKKSTDHPLMDPRFWLMDFSVCFCMLGTLTLYIIYKDFAEYMGVGQYYSLAMSCIGIGDVIGRVGFGFLASTKYVDPIFTYGLAMLLCCIVLVCHLFIQNMIHLTILSFIFGVLFGGQNVLIAVAPSEVFGREKLVIVFGHILFLGGIGALIGAPIAGAIVDVSGMYEGVLYFSIATLFAGTVLMFLCYLIHHNRMQRIPKQTVEL